MELLRNVNGKLLRCGYTTGACAAAAAKAACALLLGGQKPAQVSLPTPKGVSLTLDVLEAKIDGDSASCAIRKDAGDDPDVTHGMLVCARVTRIPEGIVIDGGQGVGRVTKPGLDQPVGAAAINRVPREMILQALRETAEQYGYSGGFAVTVSIPGGQEAARRTFNPRLGIAGGLSVLGTTGIVEPMSHQALGDTLRLELGQLAAAGKREVLLTPGNYGEAFSREVLGLSLHSHIRCGNLIGDAIDSAAALGFGRILLVGHLGKLVKLGVGITNTHSHFGDGRLETLLACALEAGASLPLLRGIAAAATTDAALLLLEEAGLLEGTMSVLGRRIDVCLERRVPEQVTIGYVCFTSALPKGVVAKSKNAEELLQIWRERE